MSLYVDIEKKLGSFQLAVHFEAERECLALLGGSGCGKSVTLRCIAGILKPDSGRIVLDGQTLFDSAQKIDLPPQKRQVGYLFQQYALFPNMTVAQNIAAAVRDKNTRAAVTQAYLERFHLLDVAQQHPIQLSGGQQQRTALARILVSQPRAILLDEPFSSLDSYLRYQLELELQETLEQFPGTVLWVTHDRGEAWRSCRRVCVLEEGRSHPVVTMKELFSAPGSESAARLSGCKNYTKAIPEGTRVTLPEWDVTLETGRVVPPEVTTVGIRSHQVQLATGGEENTFDCTVVRTIDDVSGAIVLLRPVNSGDAAPLLRMELSKEAWAAHDAQHVAVTVAPKDILLLQ
jgi:molybdate transport system ATP-binding protein